jgi:hypothetical protein
MFCLTLIKTVMVKHLTDHSKCALLCHRCGSTLCDKVCQWLATGRWLSPGTPVSSSNKTDRHYITEILLKVTLNTITLQSGNISCCSCKSTAMRSHPRWRLHSLEKQDLLRLSRTDYWYQWLIVLWNPFDFVLDCMFLLVLQWNAILKCKYVCIVYMYMYMYACICMCVYA